MGSDDREFKSSEPLLFCEVDGVDKGEEEEAKALLPSGEGGADVKEMVKWKENVKRKVQWNDDKGNRLVEILEFEPSEASDSEEEDFFDSCICSVM